MTPVDVPAGGGADGALGAGVTGDPAAAVPSAAARRRGRCRPAARTAHRAERRVDRTEGRGLGPGNERLDVVHVLGTERRRLVAGGLVDVERGEPVRPGPGRRDGAALVHLAHHRGPGRRGQHAALRVGLDLLRLVEADPDAGDQIGREADEPHVEAVVGGAGLAARGEVDPRADRATAVPWRTTSRSTSVMSQAWAVSITETERTCGCHTILPLRSSTRRIAFGMVRVPRLAKVVYAEIISSGIDVGRADVDRGVGRDPGGDAELGGLADHRVLADLHAQLDGDDVARHVERPPQRHRAVELEIVVLGRPGRLVGSISTVSGSSTMTCESG